VFSGAQFAGDAFLAIEGTISLDTKPTVPIPKKATGTFTQQLFPDLQLLDDPNGACFSSGKFTTKERLP
jgi:hypothetical protein